MGVPVDLPKTRAPALGQDREPLSVSIAKDGKGLTVELPPRNRGEAATRVEVKISDKTVRNHVSQVGWYAPRFGPEGGLQVSHQQRRTQAFAGHVTDRDAEFAIGQP